MKIQTITDDWLRSNLLDDELKLLSIFFCNLECSLEIVYTRFAPDRLA